MQARREPPWHPPGIPAQKCAEGLEGCCPDEHFAMALTVAEANSRNVRHSAVPIDAETRGMVARSSRNNFISGLVEASEAAKPVTFGNGR